MKLHSGWRRRSWIAAIVAASLLPVGGAAKAQTLTWDASGNGTVLDGSGTWSTANANWISSSLPDVVWSDNSLAVFGSANGSAGTVTVTSQVTPSGITFNPANSGSYIISGGSINLANSPMLVTMNANATISSQIVGSGGLTVSGNGSLILTNQNTYTGPTNVNGGVLQLNAGGFPGTLAPGNIVTVNGGGQLLLNATDALSFGADSATLYVNSGGTVVSEGNSRITIWNSPTMVGGVLTSIGPGNGDNNFNSNYSICGLNATSDASGNPAVINAVGVGLQNGNNNNGNAVFNVTSGGGLVDLLITSPLGSWSNGTGFTKTGSGVMVLAGRNPYNGPTFISSGVLQLANSNAAMNSTVNVNVDNGLTFAPNIGTFNLGALAGTNLLSLTDNNYAPVALNVGANGATTNYSGNISGGGSLAVTGGNLTLSGNNTYSGGTVVGGMGVLTFNSAASLPALPATNAILLTGSGALVATGPYITVTGWLTSGVINPASSGVIALTGNSSENIDFTNYPNLFLGASQGTNYTGAITPGGGAYRIGGGGAGMTISTTLTGANNLIVDDILPNDTWITLPGNITNTYSGSTTVNSGVLQVNGDAQLGTPPSSPTVNIILNGGQLFNNNSAPVLNANRTVYLGPNGGFIRNGWGQGFTIPGQITGPGSFNVVWDGGPLVLSNSTNNYRGNTTIGSVGNGDYGPGTAQLKLGVSNALPYGASAGNLVFGVNPNATGNTALLDLNGYSAQVNGINGGGNAVIDNTGSSAGTLTIGNNNQSSNFSGVIRNSGGALGLTQVGSGTLTLNGISSYSGATTIAGGTLVTPGGASLSPTSQLVVASGAAVNIGQTGLQGNYYYSGQPGNGSNGVTYFNSLSALTAQFAGVTPYVTQQSSVSSVTNFNGTRFDFGTGNYTGALANPSGNEGQGFPSQILNNNTTNFEGVWTGQIYIPVTGTYTFGTASDDGSMLFIDGNTVVNNNYFQGVTQRTGTDSLTAGYHSITIGYYQGGGGYGLNATVLSAPAGAGVPYGGEDLPQNWLSTGGTSQTISSLSGAGTVNLNSGILYAGGDNTNTTFSGILNAPSLGSSLTKVGTGTLTLTNPVMSVALVNNGPQPIVFAPATSTTISGTVTGGMLVSSGTVTSTTQNLAGTRVSVGSAGTLVAGGGGVGLVANYWDTTGGNAGQSGGPIQSNFYSIANFNASVNNLAQVYATTPTVTNLTSAPNQGNNNGQYFSFSENANTWGYFPGNYNGNGPNFTQNNFEASYQGKITISGTGAGTYTFGLNSDDGSMLFIDGTVVVNDNNFQGQNGSNPASQATGSVYLAPGPHDITILYYEGGGGYGLNASYGGPDTTGGTLENLPNSVLSPSTMTVGSLSGNGATVLQSGVNLITGGDNTSSTYAGVISGVGALTKVGNGTMILANANTFSGNTVVTAGTLQLGDGVANNGSVAGNIFNQSVVAFANPSNQTYAGTIGGAGSVIKSGGGSLTLSVGNPYTGGTQINAGTVVAGNTNALGNGTISLGGGNLLIQPSGIGGFGGNGAGWTLNRNDANGNPPSISNNVLTLTDTNNTEARSAFLNTPVNVGGNFNASFIYYNPTINNQTNTSGPAVADGVTFLLQNAGPKAVGGSGGSLGANGIASDVGVTFNVYTGHTVGIGSISGGQDPGASGFNWNPVNFLDNNDPILVNVTGSGNSNVLTVTLTDENAQFNGATQTYQLTLPGTVDSLLGASTAYVGFTGACGGLNSVQTITGFSYNNDSGPIVSGGLTIGDTGNNIAVAASGTIKVGVATPVTLGSVSFANSGSSTLTLDGIAPTITFSNLSVADSAAASIVSAAGSTTGIVLSGGTVTVGASDSATSLTISSPIVDGPTALTSLFKNGPGMLILSGSNTYTGGTDVAAGLLVVNSPTALADGSSLTVGQGASAIFAPVFAGPALTSTALEVSAVPEPGTFALFGIGAISLAGLAWRNRRRRAA